jgi:hypothetical protein
MVSMHLRPYMSSAGLDGAEMAAKKSGNVYIRVINSVYLAHPLIQGLPFDEKKIITKTKMLLGAQIRIGQRIVGFLFSEKYSDTTDSIFFVSCLTHMQGTGIHQYMLLVSSMHFLSTGHCSGKQSLSGSRRACSLLSP